MQDHGGDNQFLSQNDISINREAQVIGLTSNAIVIVHRKQIRRKKEVGYSC
jgi:hypothetical protein